MTDLSENDFELTTKNIEEKTVMCSNVVPETSKKKYTGVYQQFLDWCKKNEMNTFSEKVMLNYFMELSKKFKASTLWSQYSMLRTTLSVHHNIDIARYVNLRGFLKRKAHGYRPKKSNVFTSEQMNKFLTEAPDYDYLLMKVVLLMGVIGACARDELHNMKITDITDFGSAALVQIPRTKSKAGRKFMITGSFYKIFKKYASLRPQNFTDPTFFVNYHKGKCFIQKVGINKLGSMGKSIASYLDLSNPELYTGHCFRRSANVLIDMNGGANSFNKSKGWRYTADTEEYIDQSLKKHINSTENTTNMPENTTDNPSTSTTEDETNLDVLIKNINDIKEEFEDDYNDDYKHKNDDLISVMPTNEKSLENLATVKLEKDDDNSGVEVSNRYISESENDDHFSIFGKYIASRLRRLNNSRFQTICQQRINKVLFDFEMRSESNNN